jgi:hypothetical protein
MPLSPEFKAKTPPKSWWAWKCPRCGWEAMNEFTVNPESAPNAQADGDSGKDPDGEPEWTAVITLDTDR